MGQPDAEWNLLITTAPADFVHLSSIECGIPFAEIYERVELPSLAPVTSDKQRPVEE